MEVEKIDKEKMQKQFEDIVEEKQPTKPINLLEKTNSEDIEKENLKNKSDNEDATSIISDQNTTGYTKSKLNKLTIDKIKEICINNNFSDDGTKPILIERILSALNK